MLEPVLGLGPPAALADQVEPLELEQRVAARRRSPPDDAPRAAAGRTAARAPTPPSARRARPACSRSIRARITFSTVGGTSTVDRVVEPPPLARRARAPRRRRATARAPRGRTGSPRPARGSAAPSRPAACPGADERVEQLAVGVARQRLERDLAGPVRELARRALLHAARTGGRARAACDEDEQQRGTSRCRPAAARAAAARSASAQWRSSSDDRRPARPAARRASRLADHLERPVLEGLGRELGQPRGAPRARARARASRRGTGRPRAAGRRTARRASAAAPRRTRSSGSSREDAEPRAQQVAERPVRHRLAVGDAPALEPQRAAAARRALARPRTWRRSSASEPALADPRLAGEEQDPAGAGERRVDDLDGRRRARVRGRPGAPGPPRARARSRAPRGRRRRAYAVTGSALPLSSSSRGSPHVEHGARPGDGSPRRPARSPGSAATGAARRC